ncbi:MAG: heavy-metal-associated domain-containing protein [Pseudomonadota bacterium]
MKRSLLRICIALFLILSIDSYASTQAPVVHSTKIFLKGMVCSFCAQGLIKAFKGAEGVASVQASLDDGSITLQFLDGRTLSDESISKIAKDSGFDVKKIEPLPN